MLSLQASRARALRRLVVGEDPTTKAVERTISKRNAIIVANLVTELLTAGKSQSTMTRGQKGTKATSRLEKWVPLRKTRGTW
jgi:ribosomal protein L17